MKTLISIIAAAVFVLSAGQAMAQRDRDMFIVHELAHSPKDAVAAVRAHVEDDDEWLFLAEFSLAGGAVSALKICYLPLGKDIMAAGMHVMAMMPCGHLAFYEQDGQTRLSMLDLEFMTRLNPDPHLERAVQAGRPAFAALLQETLGIDPHAAS